MSETAFPPGPSRLKGYAHVRAFLKNRTEFMRGLWEEYGDYVRFQLGLFDVYMISDPDMIKHVLTHHRDFHKTNAIKKLRFLVGDGLLLVEDDDHRRQRRLMQPAFQPARIATYGDMMVALANDTAESWRGAEELEIHREMMGLTLRIAAQTLFNTDVGPVTDRVAAAIKTVIPFVDRIAQPTGALQMLLPTPTNFRLRRARRELNDIIYGIIEEHRAKGEDQGDLLSMLIAAQDDEGDGTGMTDRQIRDEAMTIFLAGHETTAVALGWVWHEIARHPEVEAALHEELDRVLQGRSPTMADLPELPYTRQILAETLRLYPPLYLLDRTPLEDWDTGKFVVPKGKYIFMSPFLMHRHPDHWADPERFDPDRWTPEEIAKRHKFSYFPFGGGARICIGEYFAWTEMVLVVATLAQRYRLTLPNDEPVPVMPSITFRPEGGIHMKVEARAPAEQAQPVA